MSANLWHIPLKYLSNEARGELADLLDPPTGNITMEVLGQNIDKLRDYQLGMNTQKLQSFRCQYLQRPTCVLFEYIEKKGVTIGEVMYVLDRMNAATSDIFRKYTSDIIAQYRFGSCHQGSQTNTQSQNSCECPDCPRSNDFIAGPSNALHPGPRDTLQPTHILPNRNGVASPMGRIYHRPPRPHTSSGVGIHREHVSLDESQSWSPPCCDCGETNCSVCENRRLLDPDQTPVLQVSGGINCPRQTNNLSGRPTNNVTVVNNVDNELQRNDISYTENPSSSFNLRANPDGASSYSTLPSDNTLSKCNKDYALRNSAQARQKCTCMLPPVCTCKKSKRAIEKQQSVPNGASESKVVNLNRWSTTSEPPDMQNGLSETQSRNGLSETTSSHSHSDTDINYSSHDRLNAIDSGLSSLRIFISYTDDAKDNVIAMATQLKQQGHQVSTDLQQMSFALAKKQRTCQ